MSIFWNRKTYNSFKHKIHLKSTLRDKICWHWYPCPGCIMHNSIVGEDRAEILFEAFHNRPQKSWLVYWRSHPSEWAKVMKSVSK